MKQGPAAVEGRFGSRLGLLVAVSAAVAGIMSSYFIDYGLAAVGAWRWMFAL